MNTTALAHHLNIPENLTETKLGKLRKNYDFKLSELRDYIAEYQLKKQ